MSLRYILFIILSILFIRYSYAQYPTTGNKQRLGYQTTGDGLVFRGNGVPAYTPATINNAWMYLDTTANSLYAWIDGAWELVTAGGGGASMQVFEQEFIDEISDTLTITENWGVLPLNQANIKVFQNGLKLLESQWSATASQVIISPQAAFRSSYNVRFFITGASMFTQDFVNSLTGIMTITENSGVLPEKVNIVVYQNGLKLLDSLWSKSGSNIIINSNTHYAGCTYSVDFIVY